jgi:hypothetical protein
MAELVLHPRRFTKGAASSMWPLIGQQSPNISTSISQAAKASFLAQTEGTPFTTPTKQRAHPSPPLATAIFAAVASLRRRRRRLPHHPQAASQQGGISTEERLNALEEQLAGLTGKAKRQATPDVASLSEEQQEALLEQLIELQS